MSYENANRAITNFLWRQRGPGNTPFFGFTNFGLDGDKRVEDDNCGFMSILNGQPFVRSISGPSLDVVHPGVLLVTFFFNGSVGPKRMREKADEIVDALFDQKIDLNGEAPTRLSPMVVRMGADGNAPYISEVREENPLTRTVVNAAFVRYERKQKR